MAKQLILKKKINKNVENVSKFDKKKMIQNIKKTVENFCYGNFD